MFQAFDQIQAQIPVRWIDLNPFLTIKHLNKVKVK